MATETEVELVEKIKFWEEQEKINGVLAERQIYINREFTILKAENEAIRRKLNKINNYRIISLSSLLISIIAIVIAIM